MEETKEYKYILYTKFNVQDNIYYPCMCERLENGRLLDESFKLIGVLGIRDNIFTKFEVESIHIQKENVLYILEGSYIEEDLNEYTQVEQSTTDSRSEEPPLFATESADIVAAHNPKHSKGVTK